MDDSQVRGSHKPTERKERKKKLGRGRKPLGTYLLTQNKQGQPVTEQKGGSHKQKENNKKAHLNHSSKISHTKKKKKKSATPNQERRQVPGWRRLPLVQKLPWAYLDTRGGSLLGRALRAAPAEWPRSAGRARGMLSGAFVPPVGEAPLGLLPREEGPRLGPAPSAAHPASGASPPGPG